ncbi:hypothetical protein BC941DRAFT_49809 [Chlamydoabsidia padenii]|nr:hypothetical protein BC941DRAFT_49809 [Chlamydoabsidia padenii]
MQRDGKVFTSTWLRPNEPAVVSISFPSNELYQKRCFFGLVQFYCNISYDGQSFDLAAVKALRKVDQDQKCLRGAFHDEHVDGRLYPVWSYNNNGTQNVHDKLIFIDANQIIDAVATPPETKNTTIRHLITPKQFIWEYKVVSNIDLFQLYA